MSKQPLKLSLDQIERIKTLFREGHSVTEIQKITHFPLHIVRYHVERVQLSRYQGIDHSTDYEVLKQKYKKLIELIVDL